VATAASLRAVRAQAAAEDARLRALVDRIRARVPETVADVEVVGDPEHRLPHLLTFSCLYVDGEALLHALDRAGYSVSSGSSCTSSTLTPSHVLKAMGVLSEGNVRVSLPPGTTAEQVEGFLRALREAVAGVRAELGVSAHGAAEVAPTGGELVVDARGRRCPIPVIELAKVFDRVPVGGTALVLSDDEAARLDIPAWCEMRGQEYAGEEPAAGGGTGYRVQRTS
ncbi:cysteine desulfurase/sulfurtransferase TusA family protein, partial [Streptomyces phytophilus]|uniref:cysteine desulfurase/sulfurtransferase TusA family protein n=1 Tax=Streptomyces phytophilus TaxID=722715 RepID=UPI0015F11964